MLIHLVPRLYLGERTAAKDCALVDVSLPEMALCLRAGKEVTACRPYPNKRYLVARRNGGRRAVAGILIEHAGRLEQFTMVARWTIDRGEVLTHKIEYRVIDHDFDAVSEDMILWSGMRRQAWSDRWPPALAQFSPAQLQPRMDVWSPTCGGTNPVQ